jgi:amino acid transporter
MTGVLARIGRNWRALSSEQRLAAIAALALLVSMLLPWYQETGVAVVRGRPVSIADSKNAFQVYSFVEAAIFVVTVGVLAMLWARAERKAFHLPGGDGTVVMAAGLWVMFLIFYRQLDKPNGRHAGVFSTSVGVQWGIFIAFLLGALLAYAGYRIRAAHVPEPPVEDGPGEPEPPPAPPETAPTVVARRRPAASDDIFEGQLSFDEPSEYRPPPRG